ncbi:MAG: alpha/beta hydrolase [Candidatus Promineifilaceae bacterium]
MPHFRRSLRLFLLLAGVVAGMITSLAAFFARMVIRPPRQALWATPADLGLAYEEVQFPARDGLRLSGWFLPAADGQAAATVILLHGWPWNRLGTANGSLINDVPGSSPVQLLHLALGLHRRGYQVLMFDLRNHGRSAAGGPVTFGLREADDLLGAVDYLLARPEVDPGRLAAVGFSMGANTILYSLARTPHIRAAVAVQPVTPSPFARRYLGSLVGQLWRPVLAVATWMVRAAGGLGLPAVEPIFAAAGAGATPVLYVQGDGDPWGSVADVSAMAAQTPNGATLIVPSAGRFDGYWYAIDHPDVLDGFLRQHLSN